uniref:Uncharacterized protein n=1 Tax=Cacopsylla melanoneura TaxID=428564 RepID=A0A8D8X3M7_9HEMI
MHCSQFVGFNTAAEDLRASFTPLVCSCDGALHTEFSNFLERLSLVLSEKWKKPFGHVLNWTKIRTQIAVIRAVSLRLRGTREKMRPYSFDDGAGIAYNVEE